MKNLEQYIRDNKHLFDEEPETGHFERLQQKMNRADRSIIMLRRTVAIAASVMLLVSIGILYPYITKSDGMAMTCESSDNMKLCYLDKMNDAADRIKVLTEGFDRWDRQQVLEDVESIIEATNDGLETELPDELPDEAVKSILSDYYQRNLESMQMIVQNLEKRN